MKLRRYLAMLATVLFVACALPAAAQQILNDAASALGGSARILAVKTLVIEGTGTQRSPPVRANQNR